MTFFNSFSCFSLPASNVASAAASQIFPSNPSIIVNEAASSASSGQFVGVAASSALASRRFSWRRSWEGDLFFFGAEKEGGGGGVEEKNGRSRAGLGDPQTYNLSQTLHGYDFRIIFTREKRKLRQATFSEKTA